VSFAAISLCVTSHRVVIVVAVYFVMTQSGNFWILPCIITHLRNFNRYGIWFVSHTMFAIFKIMFRWLFTMTNQLIR